MRTKGNAPPNKATQPQQQGRGSKSRTAKTRHHDEARHSASTGGTDRTRRARHSIDATSLSTTPDAAAVAPKATSKRRARCDLATPPVESRERRLDRVVAGACHSSVGRANAIFNYAAFERKAASKRHVASCKCDVSGTCLSRPSNFVRCTPSSDSHRNVNASPSVVHPVRARSQHKEFGICNIPGRIVVSCSPIETRRQSQKKMPLQKKMDNYRSRFFVQLDNDMFPHISCRNQMCILGRMRDQCDTILEQANRHETNMNESFVHETTSFEVHKRETGSAISTPEGDTHDVNDDRSLDIQKSVSIPCIDRKCVRNVQETSICAEESYVVKHTQTQTSSTSNPSPETQMSCDSVPTGWERVLLSLQVQMSPLSPCASSTVLKEKVNDLLCQNLCTFQTTSEILVLPIFTQQCQTQPNFRVSEMFSYPTIGSAPVRSSLMKEIVEYKKAQINEQSCIAQFGVPNVSGAFGTGKEENLDTSPPISTRRQHHSAGTCMTTNDFEDAGEICECDSKLTLVKHGRNLRSDKDLSSCFISRKDVDCPVSLEDKKSLFSSSENVTELQLNQNDIFKMAHEIVDVVSKIHMSSCAHLNSSENVKDDFKDIQTVRSVDLILTNSENNDHSPRTDQSLRNFCEFETDMKMEISQRTTESASDSERNEYKNFSVPDLHEVYTIEGSQNASSDNMNFINMSNIMKLSKNLPPLLYQNKKVLKHFVSKREENYIDSWSSRNSQSSPSAENSQPGMGCFGSTISTPVCNAQKGNDSRTLECKEKINNNLLDRGENIKIDIVAPLEKEKKIDIGVSVRVPDKADLKLRNKFETYDESTASEVDTERSFGVDSEAGAEDGDDEATGSASETMEETMDAQNVSPGDPAKTTACLCREKQDICHRHPTQNEESAPEGTCQCELFQEVCTESHSTLTADTYIDTGDKALQSASVDDIDVQNSNNNVRASARTGELPNVTEAESWIPWVPLDGVGPGIPDFRPLPQDNVSSVTLPPHLVQNTMNLLQENDELSLFDGTVSLPPWLPSEVRDDGVPDTMTEFHWMPDDLRGFSSTIICPEIPTDIEPYSSENRPLLYVAQKSPDLSVCGIVMQPTPASPSDATRMAINPDAPAEVPQGPYEGLDVALKGTFLDVLANTIEKALSPLKVAIDELKMKIDKLETTAHIASMRPDILVGVTSVPHCPTRPGHSDGNESQGATNCVPPFGLYIVHQHSSLMDNTVPIGANTGKMIDDWAQKYYVSGKSPLLSDKCVDKLQMVSPSPAENPSNNTKNSESLHPAQFSSPVETSCGVNASEVSKESDERGGVIQSGDSPSMSQMPPSCICPKPVSQPQPTKVLERSNQPFEKCPKCLKCKPSQIHIKSSSACDSSADPNCVECCKQPDNLCTGQQEVKSITTKFPQQTLQPDKSEARMKQKRPNTFQHKRCGVCKSCFPSVDSTRVTVAPLRCPSSNVPCYKCSTDPFLRKVSTSNTRYRTKNCPRCAQCPYPLPRPPQPPCKPRLSPIAQMYLDMSRAKHDWSDMWDGTKKDEDEKASDKSACFDGKREKKTEESSEKFIKELIDSMLDERKDQTKKGFEKSVEEPVPIDSIYVQELIDSMLDEKKDETKKKIEKSIEEAVPVDSNAEEKESDVTKKIVGKNICCFECDTIDLTFHRKSQTGTEKRDANGDSPQDYKLDEDRDAEDNSERYVGALINSMLDETMDETKKTLKKSLEEPVPIDSTYVEELVGSMLDGRKDEIKEAFEESVEEQAPIDSTYVEELVGFMLDGRKDEIKEAFEESVEEQAPVDSIYTEALLDSTLDEKRDDETTEAFEKSIEEPVPIDSDYVDELIGSMLDEKSYDETKETFEESIEEPALVDSFVEEKKNVTTEISVDKPIRCMCPKMTESNVDDKREKETEKISEIRDSPQDSKLDDDHDAEDSSERYVGEFINSMLDETMDETKKALKKSIEEPVPIDSTYVEELVGSMLDGRKDEIKEAFEESVEEQAPIDSTYVEELVGFMLDGRKDEIKEAFGESVEEQAPIDSIYVEDLVGSMLDGRKDEIKDDFEESVEDQAPVDSIYTEELLDSTLDEKRDDETTESFEKYIDEQVPVDSVYIQELLNSVLGEINDDENKKSFDKSIEEPVPVDSIVEEKKNDITKISDNELELRKLNYPCACPNEYCIPPEEFQQELEGKTKKKTKEELREKSMDEVIEEATQRTPEEKSEDET